MLDIIGNNGVQGLSSSRRRFLQIGASSAFGLSTPSLLRATTTGTGSSLSSFGRAKRCIVVFLSGGISQLDTFDMKPDAPREVRGPLKAIPTNVPGIQVSELLPLTARHADKFKIVRTVAHEHGEHSAAMHTMATGTTYPNKTAAPTKAKSTDHPHFGSIFAKQFGWRDNLPPFVQLPEVFGKIGRWPGQNAGFLGARYDPVLIQADGPYARKSPPFRLPEIQLPPGLSSRRISDRRWLLGHLDRLQRTLESQSMSDLDVWNQRALSLVGSKRFAHAADLSRESPEVHDRYGSHLWGQGLLMCRRLVEAGVPLVTIYWFDPVPAGAGGGQFDSHGRIYHHYPERLMPPCDRGLSALFDDLSERGMLDDTLVVAIGEFGRTPKVNGAAGRDHWPQTQSILLAGAGITGGSVYGKTDNHAAFPIENAVPSENLIQTFLHLLGVPPDFELFDVEGRPIPACRGNAVAGLMA